MADIRHTMSLDDQRFAAAIDRSNRRVSRMARRMNREMGGVSRGFGSMGRFGLRAGGLAAAGIGLVVHNVRRAKEELKKYNDEFPELQEMLGRTGDKAKGFWGAQRREVFLYNEGLKRQLDWYGEIGKKIVWLGQLQRFNPLGSSAASLDFTEGLIKEGRITSIVDKESNKIRQELLRTGATEPKDVARAKRFSENLRFREEQKRIGALNLPANKAEEIHRLATALHRKKLDEIDSETAREIEAKDKAERRELQRGVDKREREKQSTRERVREQRREFTEQSEQAKIRLRRLHGDEQAADAAQERLDLERRIHDIQESDLPDIEKRRLIQFDKARTAQTIEALAALSGGMEEKRRSPGRSLAAGSVSDEFTRAQVLGPLRTNPAAKAAKTAESTLAEQKKTNKKLTEISTGIKQSGGPARYG